MQFDSTKSFILEKLKSELPQQFTYHCFDHTLDVYNAAKKIGEAEGIDSHEMTLLLTAALYHDSGFIVGAPNHEERSCTITSQYLLDFDYTTKEIDQINGLIMATRLPQSPRNKLEDIICDADLDYLGRDDFFTISNLLFEEFKTTGVVKTYLEWNKLQVAFFESHHYFTKTSQTLRTQKKQANLDIIRSKIY
jgi:uncharacterized protein